MKRVIAAASAAGNRRHSSQRFLSWLLALLCLYAAGLVLAHFRPDPAAHRLVLQASRADHAPVSSENASAAMAGTADTAVNVNTAGADELCTIPGVGAVLAQSIIDERTEHGLFYYPEDLLCVRGIGEKTLIKLLPYMKLK